MNDPSSPQVGDIVDHYRLERVIGEGGFGQVFEASHANLSRKFAIKFLWTNGGVNAEALKRFKREADALATLKNPYTIQISHYGDFTKGPARHPYIVMDYLEGHTLHSYVRKNGALPVATAVDYMLQACIAIAEAHGRNILHRDIKPSNLFLTDQVGTPVIKVLDFGLAKHNSFDAAVRNDKTKTGTAIGTVGYMPAEQQRDLNKTTVRTDIFSLGATLFYLLTGRDPFPGDNGTDIMLAVMTDQAIPLQSFRPDAPAALSELLARCLSVDPDRRPQSVVELARSLVPFGSPQSLRLCETVERTFAAAEEAEAKRENDAPTIKVSHPSDEEPTRKLDGPAQRPPLAPAGPTIPLRPDNPAAPQETISGRTIIVGVVVSILIAMAAIVGTQLLYSSPMPITAPSTMIPTAKPVAAPSTSSSALPVPSASTAPSAIPTQSTKPAAQKPPPKKVTGKTL